MRDEIDRDRVVGLGTAQIHHADAVIYEIVGDTAWCRVLTRQIGPDGKAGWHEEVVVVLSALNFAKAWMAAGDAQVIELVSTEDRLKRH